MSGKIKLALFIDIFWKIMGNRCTMTFKDWCGNLKKINIKEF